MTNETPPDAPGIDISQVADRYVETTAELDELFGMEAWQRDSEWDLQVARLLEERGRLQFDATLAMIHSLQRSIELLGGSQQCTIALIGELHPYLKAALEGRSDGDN